MMEENTERDRTKVTDAYRRQSTKYDENVKLFEVFSWLGFSISGWRTASISKLNLKQGDTVVDIGCGTGLNFPYLQQEVGQDGKIIGVDLSGEMLAEAQQIIENNRWDNVELVCADAGQYEFAKDIKGILSTYTMILIPNCGQVISNACKALSPNARLVVLDMAWPNYCPLWWRHVLFFLKSYGVTAEVLKRRPWEQVQKSIEENLTNIIRKSYWFGFFYLSCGTKK